NHLRKHFGLLIITDAAFREAVRRRYLTTEEDVTTVHRHLATFHLSKDPDDADWREALWHLRGGRRWPELIRLLASLTVLGRVWKQSKDEVLGYWKEIEGETEFRLEDTYQEVLNDPLNNASSLEELLPLIDLLLQSGHSEAVKALIKKLPFVAGKPIDSVSLEGLDQVRSPLMRGEILYEGGHFEAALKEFGEEERLCRETNSDEVLSLALLKKGQTLERLGELEPAEAAYRESEQISRLGGYKRNLLLVLDAQTNFLLRLGRQQEGQALRAELEYLRGDASTDA